MSQHSGNGSSSSDISTSNSDICRICHCEADTDNPLLSPCYCAGSLKYVHQSCLRQWLAASDTRSCELCKFSFILQTKIKPLSEWRTLEMSNVERRRLLCAILFHFVAAVCVIWSLFVLIDRAAEEVQKGLIAWPFWTKLVVVAVGFTGGAVFMYIQCRQYLHLFARWKAHNRIILVQNAPEKPLMAPPTPEFAYYKHPLGHYSPPPPTTSEEPHLCYVFEAKEAGHQHHRVINHTSSSSSSRKDDIHVVEDDDNGATFTSNVGNRRKTASENNAPKNIAVSASVAPCGSTLGGSESRNVTASGSRNIIASSSLSGSKNAVDVECGSTKSAHRGSSIKMAAKTKTDDVSSSCYKSDVCKSLPNLNTTGDTFIV